MHLAPRRGELLGDLEPGVAAADHEHAPSQELAGLRYSVLCICTTSGPKRVRCLRDERNLKRACCDDDLIRLVGAIAADLDDVAVAGLADRGHPAVELNRQVASVILEI